MTKQKPKVLCVDDDGDWRDLLSQWLKPHCELEFCTQGAEVPGRVENFCPDCIVLDHELGDMLGSQICAQLKAKPALATIPVIILTSLASTMFDAVKEGRPDRFLVKSENPDELLATLKSLLAAKGFTADWQA